MELILENIRCFSHFHRIPLKPITLVTGENSSGKSTLLAALSAVTKAYKFPLSPGFNEPPFHLGNYENIATYKGGKYGRADSFKLGHKSEYRSGETEVLATYVNDRGTPILSHLFIKDTETQLDLQSSGDLVAVTGETAATPDRKKLSIRFEIKKSEAPDTSANAWLGLVFRSLITDPDKRANRELTDRLYELLDRAISGGSFNTQSIAPLRTKPLRTYDQLKDDFSPDGDHISCSSVGGALVVKPVWNHQRDF